MNCWFLRKETSTSRDLGLDLGAKAMKSQDPVGRSLGADRFSYLEDRQLEGNMLR